MKKQQQQTQQQSQPKKKKKQQQQQKAVKEPEKPTEQAPVKASVKTHKKEPWSEFFIDFGVWCVFMVHLAIAPYSKVEESFNMQACHDILYHGANIGAYDHHEFPGVVPRTFAGPALVSLFAFPFKLAADYLGLPKHAVQCAVRGVLGTFTAYAFAYLRRSVSRKYGRDTGVLFALITVAQFHLPFYATRTLPNVFALALVMFALGQLLRGHVPHAVWTLVFCCAVFRSDVAVLAGPLLVEPLLVRRTYPLFRAIGVAAVALVVSLMGTVPLDTLMWNSSVTASGALRISGPLMWPEGQVLYYNTVLNMSSNWGIMPWHWYFTSALPRALTLTVPLILLGLVREPRRALSAFLPALTFVALYSFLPHKELRFVLHAVPLFNIVAALGVAYQLRRARKSLPAALGALAALGCVAASAAATLFFTAAAANNYPGGVAFRTLHERVAPSEGFAPRVYIDVAAAQSGVTHFGESRDPRWSYVRTEGLTDFSGFTHVLTENSTVPGFAPIYAADVYAGIDRSLEALPRLFIRTKPGIYIQENVNIRKNIEVEDEVVFQ